MCTVALGAPFTPQAPGSVCPRDDVSPRGTRTGPSRPAQSTWSESGDLLLKGPALGGRGPGGWGAGLWAPWGCLAASHSYSLRFRSRATELKRPLSPKSGTHVPSLTCYRRPDSVRTGGVPSSRSTAGGSPAREGPWPQHRPAMADSCMAGPWLPGAAVGSHDSTPSPESTPLACGLVSLRII